VSPILEVVDLIAGYGRIEALHGIDMRVEQGEAVTTIGANGAGKTTLLKTIAGLIRPRRGRISLEGENVTSWSAERRARAGIALVPEGRQVFPDLSVRDNLLLGAYGRRRQSGITEDIDKVVALFPILGERGQQLAGTLSGGQQQMRHRTRAHEPAESPAPR